MRSMLEQRLQRFEELEKQLVDPDVLANSARLSAVAREHGSLARLATKYRRFKEVVTDIAEVNRMAQSSDPEERELAAEELPEPVIPKRELNFDISDEEYSVPLSVPDPKLLEQHYVAVFRLLVTQRPEYYQRIGSSELSPVELGRGLRRSRTPFGQDESGPMSAARLYDWMFLSGAKSRGPLCRETAWCG